MGCMTFSSRTWVGDRENRVQCVTIGVPYNDLYEVRASALHDTLSVQRSETLHSQRSILFVATHRKSFGVSRLVHTTAIEHWLED